MKVVLLWTVSDFPAYGMLSSWMTAGRLACPYCMEHTKALTMTNPMPISQTFSPVTLDMPRMKALCGSWIIWIIDWHTHMSYPIVGC